MCVDASVQQVLEGLETQTMKQLQMNYGVRSDLMCMRAADAQTGAHKSIHHPSSTTLALSREEGVEPIPAAHIHA